MRTRPTPLLETLKSFSPLKGYFLKNRWKLTFGLLSLLAVDFLQLLIPLVIKRAIDLLTQKGATSSVLLNHGIFILGIACAIAVFRYAWRYLIFGHSRDVERNLRNRMYEHLQRLSPAFYQRTRTGDLMARSVNDINSIRMATGMGLVALTDGVVLGFTAIAFMLSISVELTIISLIPAPIIVVLTALLTRRMSNGFETVQKTFSDLTERVREAFAGIRVVKAYVREDWEYERLKQQGQRYVAENMKLARSLALFFPMMTIFTNVGLAVVLWLGGRLTIMGHITTGDFVAFTSYLNLLTWPMMAMGWVTNLIQRGAASMRRISSVLQEAPEIKELTTYGNVPRIRGEIEVRGLTMRYPGQHGYALKDVSFCIEAGETVALVGRVGSGKTTLMQSIPRVFSLPSNAVFMDGEDILRIPLKALRQNIGFVTQDVFLFSDTIRNNVLFGRDGISKEQLEDTLKAADIFEDIQGLDKGLDTMLGERGITLSGGQRQRLTIARALVLDPPVLIMDDALSMVDTRTEERILNRILQIRRNKTNLIVSHRVPTISRADRILVLDHGELVEEGTHETLLRSGRLYTSLYQRQLLSQELELGYE